MKKALIFMLLALLMLSGCQGQVNETPATESSSPSVVESMTEETTSPPAAATESFLQPVTEIPAAPAVDVQDGCTIPDEKYKNTEHDEKNSETVDATYSATTIPEENNSETVEPTYSDTVIPEDDNSTTVDSTHSDTTIPEETKPTETDPPATTEPVRETEPPPTTEPPGQVEPTEPEETLPYQPVETEPEPEEEPEPFDIASWISFAKSYAQSIGLNLDASAVDCWDNPITAGSHCIYLERDICNRLNRYNADEDITDVWIWAVDIGNGCYELYIGYA